VVSQGAAENMCLSSMQACSRELGKLKVCLIALVNSTVFISTENFEKN
jgi:hypothetical protein